MFSWELNRALFRLTPLFEPGVCSTYELILFKIVGPFCWWPFELELVLVAEFNLGLTELTLELSPVFELTFEVDVGGKEKGELGLEDWLIFLKIKGKSNRLPVEAELKVELVELKLPNKLLPVLKPAPRPVLKPVLPLPKAFESKIKMFCCAPPPFRFA